MEFVGENSPEIIELSALHKLFNDDYYLVEALPSDIRCDHFNVEPVYVQDREHPKGYYTTYKVTVEYRVDGDSLKITRKY